MRFVIHGENVQVTDDLSAHVRRLTLAALGSFGRRIGLVSVRLYEPLDAAPAPVRCSLLLDLPPGGGLGAHAVASSPDAAVRLALAQAGDAVRKELARRCSHSCERALGYSVTW